MFKIIRKRDALQKFGHALVREAPVTYTQTRHLMKFFNAALNKFDEKRCKDFGPDRVCAEWILRNGGRIRWKGSDEWLKDYNFLPPESSVEHFKVQDIDATGTSIMKQGFRHLNDLEHLKAMKIQECQYVEDECMKNLGRAWTTLETLQVSLQKNVTDEGLMHLEALVNLTELHLKDLPDVKNKVDCYQRLKSSLPQCDVIYVDAEQEMKSASSNGT